MKKYLLFVGEHYYPSGGFDDFFGSYDSIEFAIQIITDNFKHIDWYHIVNTDTMEIVIDTRNNEDL